VRQLGNHLGGGNVSSLASAYCSVYAWELLLLRCCAGLAGSFVCCAA
jgi:hypothetical protein